MPRATIWNSQGRIDGYIDMPDGPNGGGGGGGCMLLLIVLAVVVVGIAQLIWVKTGVDVFDYFDGITGPCGTCTPTP